MQTAITNSQIDNAMMAHLGIGNVIIDFNTVALLILAVAIIILGVSIFQYIRYKRDKDNIPSLHKIENKIDFYSLDLIRQNNRVKALEDKKIEIDELHKVILELKSLILRRGNV